jgi:hypothetical protein
MIASILALLPFALFAVAGDSGQCNTGEIQCCDNSTSVSFESCKTCDAILTKDL